MSAPLSDEELRHRAMCEHAYADDNCMKSRGCECRCNTEAIRALAQAELTRRKADNEAPAGFAVGDKVTRVGGDFPTMTVLPMDRVRVVREERGVTIESYLLLSQLTLVPPRRTPMEMFRAEYATANPGSHVAGASHEAAFRATLATLGIDADKEVAE